MNNKLFGYQDDCLIAICDKKPLPQRALRSLPPWRAVFIARIALNAGLMSDEELHDIVEEAKLVGGEGKLMLPEEK